MDINILTESETKLIDHKRIEYISHDIAELACLSSAIVSLTQAMIVFHMSKDGQEVDPDFSDTSIFTILELFIKPINRFLGEGAPCLKPQGKA